MWVGDKAPLFHQPQLSIRNQCIIFTTWVSEWECYLCSERSNDPTDYSLHPFQERVARDSGRLILSDVVSLTRDAEVPVPSNRHRLYPSNPHVTQPLIYEWHLHARAPSRLRPPFSNKVCTLWYKTMVVWGRFVKTIIYQALFLGSKHAIHQKKGLILSYPVVWTRIWSHLISRKYKLKTYFWTFIFWTKISNLLLCPQLCTFVFIRITFIWREPCLRFFI